MTAPYVLYSSIFQRSLYFNNLMLCYAKSLQSFLTLFDPIDGSQPGFPVPGILQGRTLEWAAISFSNAWKWKVKVKSESEVAQSCPTLSNPMDCSLTGSSVHGIFQARVLEWGAMVILNFLYSKYYVISFKWTLTYIFLCVCVRRLLLSRFSRVRLCATP